MAVITTYTTLSTAVADYLARSDLTAYIPNFIQSFEEKFYRDSRNWTAWMESSLSITVASGLGPVPTDYKRMKVAYVSGQPGPPLKRLSVEELLMRYPRANSSGQAVYFARQGANFIFGPNIGSATVVGTYYAKPVLLRNFASDAAANWLIVNAPDLLLYGALLEAETFLKNDSRLVVWKSFKDEALDAYRSGFKEEEYLSPTMVAG